MNIYFKIKHYLKPYFLLNPSYKFNEVSKGFNLNYWVEGYSQNIINKKWAIENGIPLGLYTQNLNLGLEKRVHIAGLCEYCFANIELGLEAKNIVVLDFLFKNISHKNDNKLDFEYSFWKTFSDPYNDIYYVHGMGQGQILSLLSRYWILTKDPKYLKLSLKVSNSYLVDFEDDNGFVNLIDGTFFEEYPKNDTDRKVLNGWMYSIIGMHDYLKIATKETDIFLDQKKKLYENSIITLINNLKNYNIYFWSTYCQPNSIFNICSIHYQIQHITFLNAMFHITQRSEFRSFSRKLLFQFYNPLFRILSLFSKLLISNVFKYGRLYKSK